MTVKELEKILELKNEMEYLTECIVRIKARAQNATARISAEPINRYTTDKVGNGTCKLGEYKDRLTEARREYNGLILQIGRIPDKDVRKIVFLRYVVGLSWRRIAHALSSTVRRVRYAHDKYIQE